MALMPDSIDQAESAKFQTEFEEFQEKNREQKEAWKKEKETLVSILSPWRCCCQVVITDRL